jgi:hypothetical protein
LHGGGNSRSGSRGRVAWGASDDRATSGPHLALGG